MSTITITTHRPPESGPVAIADRGRWERVLMRAIYDPTFWLAERLGMSRRRASLLARADGRVLEIGAGTGLNAGHWPDGLDGLVVTEPLTTLLPRIQRRLLRAGRDASVLGAEAEHLPLADDSVDTRRQRQEDRRRGRARLRLSLGGVLGGALGSALHVPARLVRPRAAVG